MAETFIFHVLDDRTLGFRQTEPIMLEDNHVTEFRFRIPKTLNELDVTSWSWWFVYKNANGDKYSSPLLLTDDVDEPESYSVATYVVDHGFTQKAGRVKIALEALNIGTGDAPTNEWHTKTYIIDVNDTLQGNQIEFKPSEVDIISGMLQGTLNQIREMIKSGGVGGGTSDDIENKSNVSGSTVTDAFNAVSDQLAQEQTTRAGADESLRQAIDNLVSPSGQSVVVDSSLSISGAAADAKATGDKIDDLKSKIAQNGNKVPEDVKTILTNMMTLFSAVSFYNDEVDVPTIGEETSELIAGLNVVVPELTGIEAVFNQTEVIYSDATLEDLKEYLTVTGEYTDGSTRTLTDYTLSGTISAGVQTFTVTVNDFTDTFTATITKFEPNLVYSLPAETVFDGTNTINTGFNPYANSTDDMSWTILCACKFDTSQTNHSVFGYDDKNAQGVMGVAFKTGTTQAGKRKVVFFYNGKTEFCENFFPSAGEHTYRVSITHTAGNNNIKVDVSYDGVRKETNKGVTALSTYRQVASKNLRVGSETSSGQFVGTVSDFKIYSAVLDADSINEFLGC